MPVKLDTTVTVIDMVAISGVIISGAFFVFGYGGEIETNSQAIAYVQTDLQRIEAKSDKADDSVLEQLKINHEGMEKIGDKSEKGRQRIEDKIDRLIERALIVK